MADVLTAPPIDKEHEMNGYTLSRRRLLRHIARALPVIAGLTLFGRGGPAQAGQAAKADFHYQDQPNEGKRCADCVAFVPPSAGQAAGSCNIVAGPVSPNGWCMAFSPKG